MGQGKEQCRRKKQSSYVANCFGLVCLVTGVVGTLVSNLLLHSLLKSSTSEDVTITDHGAVELQTVMNSKYNCNPKFEVVHFTHGA